MDVETVVKRVGAFQHLERERGVKQIAAWVSEGIQQETWDDLVAALKELEDGEAWEGHLGALLAAQVLIPASEDERYDRRIEERARSLLSAPEVRVRNAVADVLGALAAKHGPAVWTHSQDLITAGIRDNFERPEEAADAEEADGVEDDRNLPGSPALGNQQAPSLMGALLASSYQPAVPGQGTCRHMTEGWKALESSVRCVHRIMAGAGSAFAPHATPELRELLYSCLNHMNRFVRETAYLALTALCDALHQTPELEGMALELADKLRDGLSDNWSQVRFAASRAARALCQGIPERALDGVYGILLPPMCLNRYYVAEGVRVFSQETWRLLMGDEGRHRVAQHIDAVVPYYISQSKANNHAVREAACACCAELCTKVDASAVAPHVPAILFALIVCFKDESWPCRDAASTACGRAVAAFPDVAAPRLPELYRLWQEHLWDNVSSVRENTAAALARVVAAVPDAAQVVESWLDDNLLAAREQPGESHEFSQLENTTLFGVAARRAAAADILAKHTDQPMFSCGSLAPKTRGSSCMDHGVARAKEPWEASDGAVMLLRELAAVTPAAVEVRLPALAQVAAMSHFQHAPKLRETVWTCLPVIARRLGKKLFKPHLELFLEPLFRDLRCDAQLCRCAAGGCIAALRDWLGMSVLAGRLDEWQKGQLVTSSEIPEKIVWKGEDDAGELSADREASENGDAAPKKPKPGGIAERLMALPPGSAIPNLLGK